jgi:nucleoside-diphosphate-sugar epimerase
MRIVLIGGSGTVGRLLITHLAGRHELVVIDPAPVDSPAVTHIVTDVTRPGALDALAGADAAVHLAAVVPLADEAAHGDRVAGAFAVNVGSVYASLAAAAGHQLAAFVHISTMSVYAHYGHWPIDPATPPDATEPYGLSKRLAEDACRALANRGESPSVCSLRLAYPTPDGDWPRWRLPETGTLRQPRGPDGTPITALAATDLAAGVTAALHYRGPYRTFAIVGDPGTIHRDDTAQVLGWTPTRTADPETRP